MQLISILVVLFTFYSSYTDSNPNEEALILQGVNIITLENEVLLENHDVLIVAGSIESIGTNLNIPPNARVVDASELFLMPALFDMHAHVSYQNPWHEYQLGLYTYFGVHHVNLMSGNDGLKELSDLFNNRSFRLGPTITLASELIDGDPPMWGDQHNGPILTNSDQVEDTLLELKEKGYRDLKVYNRLPTEVYLTILATADRLGMNVVGHVPNELNPEYRLDRRHQRIDHLEGYLEYTFTGNSVDITGSYMERQEVLIDGYDRNKMKEAAQLTVKREIWNTPTQVLYTSLTDSVYIDEMLNGEYSDWVDEGLKQFWTGIAGNSQAMPQLRSLDSKEIRLDIIGELHKAGAKFLAGTDSPLPVLLYGHALHRELQYFVEAGMSPFEALQTATSNPAEFLGLKNTGKVLEGYSAELLLLKANPLDDIQNTLEIEAVIYRNEYLERSEIESILNEIKERLAEN